MALPDDPLKWGITALKDTRSAQYATYRQYLSGVQPLAFATEKFRSAFGRLFDTFSYNRCAMVVDAHADRLCVDGFGADDDALAQKAQELWDDNRMDVREGQVEADAFALGDAYVIVEQHPETGAIHLWPQAAEAIRVHYTDDEPDKIDLAVKRWVGEDKRIYVTLYFADRIEKYRTLTASTGLSTSARLERFQADGDAGWPVMLGIDDTVPVFHVANNAPVNGYGVSELRDVIPLQDAINKTLMDMLVTMEFAAFPQRVLINVDTDDDNTVEAVRKFQAGVDRLLTLLGTADGKPPSIAEFSAANIAQYTEVVELFDKTISRVSKVPVHYLSMSGDFPSGRALRIAEAPFVAKIEDRQRSMGQAWADAVRYGLRLSGTEVEPGALRVNWASAAPLSQEDKLDIALQKDAVGYPFEAILREMGYEPKQLAQIMGERDQAAEQAARQFNAGAVRPGFGEGEEAAD